MNIDISNVAYWSAPQTSVAWAKLNTNQKREEGGVAKNDERKDKLDETCSKRFSTFHAR